MPRPHQHIIRHHHRPHRMGGIYINTPLPGFVVGLLSGVATTSIMLALHINPAAAVVAGAIAGITIGICSALISFAARSVSSVSSAGFVEKLAAKPADGDPNLAASPAIQF